MNDPLKREQRRLIEYHKSNGFIDIRKLSNGTRIVIKTIDEVYELEVGTAKHGVVLVGSERRFLQRDKAVVTGGLDPETRIFVPRIIGEGLKLTMRLRDGEIVQTSPVVYARIVGDSYEYELWGSYHAV